MLTGAKAWDLNRTYLPNFIDAEQINEESEPSSLFNANSSMFYFIVFITTDPGDSYSAPVDHHLSTAMRSSHAYFVCGYLPWKPDTFNSYVSFCFLSFFLPPWKCTFPLSWIHVLLRLLAGLHWLVSDFHNARAKLSTRRSPFCHQELDDIREWQLPPIAVRQVSKCVSHNYFLQPFAFMTTHYDLGKVRFIVKTFDKLRVPLD